MCRSAKRIREQFAILLLQQSAVTKIVATLRQHTLHWSGMSTLASSPCTRPSVCSFVDMWQHDAGSCKQDMLPITHLQSVLELILHLPSIYLQSILDSFPVHLITFFNHQRN